MVIYLSREKKISLSEENLKSLFQHSTLECLNLNESREQYLKEM